jgi:hypothetical protein
MSIFECNISEYLVKSLCLPVQKAYLLMVFYYPGRLSLKSNFYKIKYEKLFCTTTTKYIIFSNVFQKIAQLQVYNIEGGLELLIP